MNDVPDTELFSAYLDGELTADEQVRVEQILATSPEARQLLEELRALGSTLQELPQEKLDEDLSARVLEIAERRMLLPDDQAATGGKPSAGRAAEALRPVRRGLGRLAGNSLAGDLLAGHAQQAGVDLVGRRRGHGDLPRLYVAPETKPCCPARGATRRGAPAASEEARSGSSPADTSSHGDGDWDVPAGQPRVLKTDALRAKDGMLARDEKRKTVDAVAAGRHEDRLAERALEKKAAAPGDALADGKPAAVPLFAEPAAAGPSPSELPSADAARSAAAPPPPAVVMSGSTAAPNLPVAPKVPTVSKAFAGSQAPAASQALGARVAANAKRGAERGGSEEFDKADEGVVRRGARNNS